MKKRFLAMILVAAFAIVAASCGNIANTTEATEATTEATEATTEATEATTEATEATTEATEATTEATEATTEATKATDDPAQTGAFIIKTEDGAYVSSKNTWTITSAGTYTLTGTLNDGQIIVAAGDDEVELDLSGVTVTCSYDSPVYVESADKVKIKAVANTVNVINDTRSQMKSSSEDLGAAAIYSKCDLNLIGTGTLVVNASYNNGIQTKDDLKVKNLTLSVTAPNDALKGNDSLTVESGTITVISASGDGLATSNSDVSSKGNQRGTVTVSGGTLNIYAGCDGIDAAYDVIISGDAVINIKTNSYSSYSTAAVIKSNETSKGVKADNAIDISGGTLVIYSMDDGIHANNDNALENGSKPLGNVTVSGGSVTITAADDGIHADGTLLIDDGYIDVVKSHEGLEGNYVTINGGEIFVYATDDGVNASASSSGRSDGLITVTGGKVIVEVAGRDVDGIDSNGSYKQTGGFVVVSNPNADSSGNMSAVDVDSTISITGGVIIALGTVPGQGGGMGGGRFGMGGMSSHSSLPSGYVTFSGTLGAGSHTFTFGNVSETFTLKARVSSGWIWALGISSSNYTLK